MLKRLKEFTKEELQNIIYESTSISEIVLKIGYKKCGGSYNTNLKKYLVENDFDLSQLPGRHFKKYSNKGIPKKWLSEVLTENSTGNSNKLKQKLINCGIKEYKCENPECGISDWHNKPIKLELHHINGNHYDNRLENLVLLCPNCHSQTSNFRGKNSENELTKVLSEIAIDESKTALENLLNIENQRKKEIEKNKKIYVKKENKKTKIIKYCKQCGKEIKGKGKVFCSIECMNKYQKEVSGYDINDILEVAKKCKTIVEIAKHFNVTDNGIKKRLKREGKLEEVKKIIKCNKKDCTVLQFDLNNNFIKEWENAIVASKELNINKNHIYSCCKNLQKTCGGYIWKLKNNT